MACRLLQGSGSTSGSAKSSCSFRMLMFMPNADCKAVTMRASPQLLRKADQREHHGRMDAVQHPVAAQVIHADGHGTVDGHIRVHRDPAHDLARHASQTLGEFGRLRVCAQQLENLCLDQGPGLRDIAILELVRQRLRVCLHDTSPVEDLGPRYQVAAPRDRSTGGSSPARSPFLHAARGGCSPTAPSRIMRAQWQPEPPDIPSATRPGPESRGGPSAADEGSRSPDTQASPG